MHTTGEKPCRSSSYLGAALSVTVALILQAFCWGFTVDDAWIVARVAAHGLSDGVFAFNSSGPPTDAVTPLGFAQFLAILGKGLGHVSPLKLWNLSRVLGGASYLVSMALAGFLVAKHNPKGRLWWGAALALLTLPAAAWSTAGLATPIVGLLVIVGAALVEGHAASLGTLALGGAAALRPELAPFTCAVLLTRGAHDLKNIRGLVRLSGVWLALPLLVAVVRLAKFGSAIPLAAVAKAPDLTSALFYAAMTALWCGLSWLVLARDGAFSRGRLWAVPWCVHLVALVYSGGDWMPALRLSAPVMPLLVWTVGREIKPNWRFWVAAIPAVGFSLALGLTQGDDLRRVVERRLSLVEAGRGALKNATTIATVDIGWVGLSSTANIVDLAGVTDPRIAALPGGHTSKAISAGLFSDRDVDTWVIRALDRSYQLGQPLELIVPAYIVDARLLRQNVDLGFVGAAILPLRGTKGQYVIARRARFAGVLARGDM